MEGSRLAVCVAVPEHVIRVAVVDILVLCMRLTANCWYVVVLVLPLLQLRSGSCSRYCGADILGRCWYLCGTFPDVVPIDVEIVLLL